MTPALLFDLDGTLIRSDPLHAAVFMDFFAEHGVEIDERTYTDRISGLRNDEIFARFLPDGDAAALSAEKEARFRARLGDEADPMPGLPALLATARDRGWRMAVVTNAPRENAEAMLSALGLSDGFETLVVADELARGKPDPLPYLTALDRLGLSARDALAFEDSPSGVRAAHAAGITTIGLRSSQDHETLMSAGAAGSIADFNDPGLTSWLETLTEETQ